MSWNKKIQSTDSKVTWAHCCRVKQCGWQKTGGTKYFKAHNHSQCFFFVACFVVVVLFCFCIQSLQTKSWDDSHCSFLIKNTTENSKKLIHMPLGSGHFKWTLVQASERILKMDGQHNPSSTYRPSRGSIKFTLFWWWLCRRRDPWDVLVSAEAEIADLTSYNCSNWAWSLGIGFLNYLKWKQPS